MRILFLALPLAISACAGSFSSIHKKCIDETHNVGGIATCLEQKLDAEMPRWRIADEHGPAVHEYIECIKNYSEQIKSGKMTENEAQAKLAEKLDEMKTNKKPSGSCERPKGGGGGFGAPIPMVTCTTSGTGRSSTTICFHPANHAARPGEGFDELAERVARTGQRRHRELERFEHLCYLR